MRLYMSTINLPHLSLREKRVCPGEDTEKDAVRSLMFASCLSFILSFVVVLGFELRALNF
jgi:hypothetical protein